MLFNWIKNPAKAYLVVFAPAVDVQNVGPALAQVRDDLRRPICGRNYLDGHDRFEQSTVCVGQQLQPMVPY